MRERFEELDSLRGVAAMTVVMYHLALWMPVMAADTRGDSSHAVLNAFKYSPLRVFIAGPEAVSVFFVLSGFVLALGFLRPRPTRYAPYLVKRVCRLWVPYAAVILVGAAVAVTLSRGVPAGIVSYSFTTPVTWPLIAEHLGFIGDFDIRAINPPIWSLVHEMRISLLFPLLAVSVARLHWTVNLLAWCGLALLGPWLTVEVGPWMSSLAYLPHFVVGALLAKHRTALVAWVAERRRWSRAAAFVVAVLLLTAQWWLYLGHPRQSQYALWSSVLGAAILVVLALASPSASRVLLRRPVAYLGRISYSLYLVHVLVLFSLVKLLHPQVPYLATCVLALAVMLPLAAISYRWIEVPSIALGRSLARRLQLDPSVTAPPQDGSDHRTGRDMPLLQAPPAAIGARHGGK